MLDGGAAGTHRVRILDGGPEAYPRMLAALEAARASVHLEVYSFALDATGERFEEALAAAARRGVRVRVVLDGVGSALDGRAAQARLGAAGVEVSIYNPLLALLVGRLRRNHRKVLIVDGEVAFLGGINIGDEYAGGGEGAPWADLAAEIRGPACAWLARRLEGQRAPPPRGPVRILLSGLGGGRRLRRRYLKAVGAARHAVLVAHAYFLPDRRLVRTITAASRRGVAVTLLLAGRSDVPFARSATVRLYGGLLRAGVRIVEWERSILHAKVAVVDGRRLLLGSFNLDPLSLANLEVLLEARGAPAREAARWIERHVARGRAVLAAELADRSALQRFLLDRLGLWAARAAQLAGRLLGRREVADRTPGGGRSSG
ncbi:MAG TPA: phospholipase D-like domain-containing protein [Anaeromyxobacteraceae bacterium]|jgi:cardiolipin synthase